MKKFTFVSWLILFSALTASCQFPGTKIQPGDKVGNMEFINEAENCQARNILHDICTEKELSNGTCEVPSYLTKFWISMGWAEGSQKSLDLSWKDSEWSMTFDGLEVDLYAFGNYDTDWTDPQGNSWRARVWNVCVSNPASGKHTVVYNFLLKNGVSLGNHEAVFNFTVLPEVIP